jgi:hypothetical protein
VSRVVDDGGSHAGEGSHAWLNLVSLQTQGKNISKYSYTVKPVYSTYLWDQRKSSAICRDVLFRGTCKSGPK